MPNKNMSLEIATKNLPFYCFSIANKKGYELMPCKFHIYFLKYNYGFALP